MRCCSVCWFCFLVISKFPLLLILFFHFQMRVKWFLESPFLRLNLWDSSLSIWSFCSIVYFSLTVCRDFKLENFNSWVFCLFFKQTVAFAFLFCLKILVAKKQHKKILFFQWRLNSPGNASFYTLFCTLYFHFVANFLVV